MPVTVSVVVPVRNDAGPLAVCLRALRAQSVPPDEIVVVDNGSTDDSAAVARAAGARVVPCAGGGIPAASAAGYDAARCDVIARLDADSVPSATWVASIVAAFAEHPTIGAITGGASFVDGPVVLRRVLAAVYLAMYYLCTMPALGHLTLFGSNMAMRRTAWEATRFTVHRRDRFVHDDLDLAFHLGRDHRIRFERRMRMGVSMRPFFSAASLALRGVRGLYTVLMHYPFDVAPVRWLRRMPPSWGVVVAFGDVVEEVGADGRAPAGAGSQA